MARRKLCRTFDAPPLRRRRLAFLFASTLLLVTSIVWCIATLHSPQRFIFLPGGDVGLGFRSYAGLLQWVEYAPWDISNMDYPWCSVPWAVIIAAISLLVIWQFRFLRRTTIKDLTPTAVGVFPMADKSNAIRILARPMQPGAFRVCPECRSWFALIQVAERDNELKGSITTYSCKKCHAIFDFADRHPPDAI